MQLSTGRPAIPSRFSALFGVFSFVALPCVVLAQSESRASVSPAAQPPPSGASAPGAAPTPSAGPALDAKTTAPAKSAEAEVRDGLRVPDFLNYMKQAYPEATTFKESELLPAYYGGSSFLGLVSRLYGEGLHNETEGLRVRRFLYHAFKDDKPVGVAHGSSAEVQGNSFNVIVLYTPGGTIKEVRTENIPANTLKELVDGGYLKQFAGHQTEEFEVTLGRKGRIKSRGAFLTSNRKPGNSTTRAYYDKILRSVRVNAAFMDVAYFITQHPDLADQGGDHPDLTPGAPETGPEAFARSNASDHGSSPIDGKPFLLQELKAPEPKKP